MKNKYHAILSKAKNEFENKNYEKSITELESFVNNQNITIKQQANSLMGLNYFHLGKNKESELYFNQACSTSEFFFDWFNLTNASALNRHFDLSTQAFNKTIAYCQNEESSFIPKLRLYYVNTLLKVKAYEIALEQLNILWESYIFYGVTDDHFLYIRGLPYFTQFIEAAIEVLNGLSSKFDKKSWFSMIYESIDEEGKAVIDQFKSKLNESSKNELNAIFDIQLPAHPKLRPVKAQIEDIINENSIYIVCRVLEGTLKLGDLITLKKHNGQLIAGKCSKLEILTREEVKELPYKSIGMVYLEGISIDEIRIGDLLISSEL